MNRLNRVENPEIYPRAHRNLTKDKVVLRNPNNYSVNILEIIVNICVLVWRKKGNRDKGRKEVDRGKLIHA